MSDKWIREKAQNTGMIEPFEDRQKRNGVISYGLSSYGYDARVSDEFKIFTNVDSVTVPAMFALFRQIHLPLPAPLNISVYRKMCWSSALVNQPTRAAVSLSTSPRLSPDGKAM